VIEKEITCARLAAVDDRRDRDFAEPMRIWTLHPKYLDPRGLVALWREALLARAVLRNQTSGYRAHPQLQRFRAHPAPLSAINAYLRGVLAESLARGYAFDATKVGPVRGHVSLDASAGQLELEWQHLLAKLGERAPALFDQWRNVSSPDPHPLFAIVPGPVASWERGTATSGVKVRPERPAKRH